jgi:hypothetical protein
MTDSLQLPISFWTLSTMLLIFETHDVSGVGYTAIFTCMVVILADVLF